MLHGSIRTEYLPQNADIIRLVGSWIFSEFGHLDPASNLESTIQQFRHCAGRRDLPCSLIACAGDAVVGTATLTSKGMKIPTGLAPWLGAVYVLPNFRKRGVGTALCRRAIDEARRLDFQRLYLYTADRQDFYSSLGWVAIRRTEYQGEDVTIMMRSLIDPEPD